MIFISNCTVASLDPDVKSWSQAPSSAQMKHAFCGTKGSWFGHGTRFDGHAHGSGVHRLGWIGAKEPMSW